MWQSNQMFRFFVQPAIPLERLSQQVRATLRDQDIRENTFVVDAILDVVQNDVEICFVNLNDPAMTCAKRYRKSSFQCRRIFEREARELLLFCE